MHTKGKLTDYDKGYEQGYKEAIEVSLKDIKEGISVVALRDSGLQGTLYKKGDLCIIGNITSKLVTIRDRDTHVIIAQCWTKNFFKDWKLETKMEPAIAQTEEK